MNMNTEKNIGVRLNKAIATTGFCSRRKADELIFTGRVRVNDTPEQNPASHVLPSDTISVDGRVLNEPEKFVYALLNKPVHVVSSVHDPQGRRTVVDCLPEALENFRLYPVGRLDYFSEGLLLLTNDGDLTHRLLHPSCCQEKKYEVLVRGLVDTAVLQTMRSGMSLSEGEKLLPIVADRKSVDRGNTVLALALKQGVNRQVRRMCRDLNLTILRLKRTSHGILTLGELALGQTRLLYVDEVAMLRKSTGLQ
ncbi:MAG: rRNA pseudouridine synthase [Desulfovibrio sp.]|jgi:23S rRNA pseudouridine2605 synthase|nr:rRNA pseudouridine synthase [Desulfovibrio sp.]